jgi:two-component system chemotaxis sensor kinase CheA
LAVLCTPGFSTKGVVTEVSGRGVGLDAVQTELNAHGGSLILERTDGRGTVFGFSWDLMETDAGPIEARSA